MKKQGFTLIEVLGSIFILSILIAVSSQVSYGNFKKAQKAKILETSTRLLQIKMSELEAEYKGDDIILLPNEERGEFEQEQNYTWEYGTQKLQMPPGSILLSMQGLLPTKTNIQVIKIIKQVLSSTVIELKLTVTYTKGKRSSNYSLVSYFINYRIVPVEVRGLISQFIPAGGGVL